MNSKHRNTLASVFAVPVRSDVEWREIEALFLACGARVTYRGGSRVSVVLNDVVANFHRPHPEKEISKAALRSVRRFSSTAGVNP
jgi:hypothetical protein